MELKDYGMSRERGFLSHYEIDEVALPSLLDEVTEAAGNLSGLLSTGRVRHWLGQLADPGLEDWAREAAEEEVRTAMVHYSFLVQAYVWGEALPPAHLPANLARPMVAVADRLGQAPLLPYSAYVLDNWARLDKSGPITLENIYMAQNFLGGVDENWFVMIHVAIEAEAGVLLDNAAKLVTVAQQGDAAEAERLLVEMDAAWERIYGHFGRMTEQCDPYIYFHRVRPYIHGWANNPALGEGLVYDGVDRFERKPQAYRGQTGSQSSIVPSMDALFQVGHSDDPLRRFLDELHHYRPVPHRRFIEDLAAKSTLRGFVSGSGSQSLKDAFNACVEQTARFRTRHLEYAASYINKQAGSIAGNDPDVGTGGTPFMKYLKKHRDENGHSWFKQSCIYGGFTRPCERRRVDLSVTPVVPIAVDEAVVDRLTISVIRETTALDFEMEAWLVAIGQGAATRSCGLRIRAFSQHLEAMRPSAKQKKRIAKALCEIEQALSIRNALTHGQFEFGTRDDKPIVFVQTLEMREVGASARICIALEAIVSAVASLRQAHRMLSLFRRQRQNTIKAPSTDEF